MHVFWGGWTCRRGREKRLRRGETELQSQVSRMRCGLLSCFVLPTGGISIYALTRVLTHSMQGDTLFAMTFRANEEASGVI